MNGGSGAAGSPETPPGGHATGREGDNRETIAALVRDLGETGRAATDEEIQRLRTYFATVALRQQPNLAEVEDDLGGLEWEGRILRGGQFMDRLSAKYLYHVQVRQEWPAGTTPGAYLTGLAQAIEHPSGGISLGQDDAGSWRLLFVARSGRWRGPHGGDLIVVGFLAEEGRWLTGFQPDQGRAYVQRHQRRLRGRWLRRAN